MSERDPAANGSGTTDTEGGSSAVDQARTAGTPVTQTAGQALHTAQAKVGQVAGQAATTANQGMDAAAGGLNSLAGTIRDRSQSMSGQGPSGTAQQAAAAAADKLETAAQYLRQTDPEQLVTELEALVRRRPVEAVLVAVGLGFLLSRVIR